MSTIAERLANKNVAQELQSLDWYLQRLPPDGKTNHRKCSLRQKIYLDMDYIEEKYQKGISFKELKEKESSWHDEAVNSVIKAIASFGYKV